MSHAHRTTSRGRQTRSRVLAAARAVVLRDGPAGLTMRAVAAEAGLSLGNLQFHFANPTALLRGILDVELEVGEKEVARAIAQARPGQELEAAIDAMFEVQLSSESGQLFFSLWAFATTLEPVRAALHAFYARWINRLAERLRAERAALSRQEARHRALGFVAALEGVSLFRYGIAGELTGTEQRALRSLLKGLLGKGSPC